MKQLHALSIVLATAIAIILSSCTCKDCPPGWQPSAFAPVFYGYRDYHQPSISIDPLAPGDLKTKPIFAGFPPGDCRIFYPSTDGSPQNAPPLEGCCKFPLIILVHGHCLDHEAEQYQKWFLLPAQLARSGYVVLVPSVPSISGLPSPDHPALPVLESYRNWILQYWEFHELVHSNTGMIGHSFGAPIAATFSKTHPEVKAFASLSGQYEGVNDYRNLNRPVLLMRGNPSSDIGEAFVGFDWNGTPSPKHRAEIVEGYHWDYMLPGQVNCNNSQGRGDCSKNPQLYTELITMFFTRYLRRTNNVDSRVPLSLLPPDITLTTDQQFYAGGGYLGAFGNLGEECQVNLAWVTAEGSGSSNQP